MTRARILQPGQFFRDRYNQAFVCTGIRHIVKRRIRIEVRCLWSPYSSDCWARPGTSYWLSPLQEVVV